MSAQLVDGRAPVSAVIPCYCCSETIGRALASIASQTMLPHEVILVEDASPDGGKTLGKLRHLADEYGESFVVKIVSLKENGGAGSARNRGWEAAGQPYIAFLDADDAWHPKKIELQYSWMCEHPEYPLVGHGHLTRLESEENCPVPVTDASARFVSKTMALVSNPFATITVMLKRDLPFRFQEGKRYAEDYLLWLQIIQTGVPVAYLNAQLASTYKDDYGSTGLSAQLWKMEAGVLDTYWVLHKQGAISTVMATCLSMFSLAKYVRRVAIVLGRRLLTGSHESVV